jgi:hypothetical protein
MKSNLARKTAEIGQGGNKKFGRVWTLRDRYREARALYSCLPTQRMQMVVVFPNDRENGGCARAFCWPASRKLIQEI